MKSSAPAAGAHVAAIARGALVRARSRARLEAERPKIVVIDSSWRAYPQRPARTLHALVYAYLAAHHYVQRGRVYIRPDLIGPANDAPLKPATTDVTFDGK